MSDFDDVWDTETWTDEYFIPDETIITNEPSGLLSKSDYNRISMIAPDQPIGPKYTRDPKAVFVEQIRGILDEYVFDSFKESHKNSAVEFIESIPINKLALYNAKTLATAALYTIINKELNFSKVTTFIKQTEGMTQINNLDFIRYARMLISL
jgi:hypothetical protein